MPTLEAGPDFIATCDGALDEAACHAIIERFESSGQATRGRTGSGVNTALKNSWDICIDHHPEWADVVGELNRVMAHALMAYVRRFPRLLLAPLSLSMKSPDGSGLVPLTDEALRTMADDQLLALVTRVLRPGTINVQKYLADEGGYPYWHCEFYPKAGDLDALHRILLWSVYLNDGFDAGETEFFYQERKIQPRTGRLVMAPAGFTHTHRGNRPAGGDKYIATSWVLFQTAGKLYG